MQDWRRSVLKRHEAEDSTRRDLQVYREREGERETEGARTHGLGEAARLDSTRHKTSVGARSKRAMADAAGGQLKAVAAGAGEE